MKEALAAVVLLRVATRWARCLRHGDRDKDKETQPLMQKPVGGAFSRHQAALIALSAEGNRQVASGLLSEMIQNNLACQEAHDQPAAGPESPNDVKDPAVKP